VVETVPTNRSQQVQSPVRAQNVLAPDRWNA
jgi:hypothetical protein